MQQLLPQVSAVCSPEIVGAPTISQPCLAWPLCVCRDQQVPGGAEAAAPQGIGVVRRVLACLSVLFVVTGSSYI